VREEEAKREERRQVGARSGEDKKQRQKGGKGGRTKFYSIDENTLDIILEDNGKLVVGTTLHPSGTNVPTVEGARTS
jgi:hypothetical protein